VKKGSISVESVWDGVEGNPPGRGEKPSGRLREKGTAPNKKFDLERWRLLIRGNCVEGKKSDDVRGKGRTGEKKLPRSVERHDKKEEKIGTREKKLLSPGKGPPSRKDPEWTWLGGG